MHTFSVLVLLIFVSFQLNDAAPLRKVKKTSLKRVTAAPIGGDPSLFRVGEVVYKIAAFPKPTSYDAATLYFRRQLGNNTKATATLATIRNEDEDDAISDALAKRQYRSAMIGLKLDRTPWRWVADNSPVRGQGIHAVDDSQLFDKPLRLICAKDCVSYCQYSNMRYALFQEESLKCHCSDKIIYEPNCGSMGCMRADEYGFYDASNGTYDHWADGLPKLTRACAALSLGDGNQWVDRQCTDRLPFVCEFDRWVIASMHIENKACFSKGKCMALFKDRPLTFDEAQQYCLENQGMLAKIGSFERQLDVEIALANFTQPSSAITNNRIPRAATVLQPSSGSGRAQTTPQQQPAQISYVWIGASNADYVWPDGSSTTGNSGDERDPNDGGYSNWDDTQPDTTYECVAIENVNHDGVYKWVTRRCESANVFVGAFYNLDDGILPTEPFSPPTTPIIAQPPPTPGAQVALVSSTAPTTTTSQDLRPPQTPGKQVVVEESSTVCDVTCGIWILLVVIIVIQFILLIILCIYLCTRRYRKAVVHPSETNTTTTTTTVIDNDGYGPVICCCNAEVSGARDGLFCCCQTEPGPNDDETPSCCMFAICSPMVKKTPPPPKEILIAIDQEKTILAAIEQTQKEQEGTLDETFKVVKEVKFEVKEIREMNKPQTPPLEPPKPPVPLVVVTYPPNNTGNQTASISQPIVVTKPDSSPTPQPLVVIPFPPTPAPPVSPSIILESGPAVVVNVKGEHYVDLPNSGRETPIDVKVHSGRHSSRKEKEAHTTRSEDYQQVLRSPERHRQEPINVNVNMTCCPHDKQPMPEPQSSPPVDTTHIEERLDVITFTQKKLVELVKKCAEREDNSSPIGLRWVHSIEGPNPPNQEQVIDSRLLVDEHNQSPSPRPSSPAALPDARSMPSLIKIKVRKNKKGKIVSRTTIISPRTVIAKAGRRRSRKIITSRNPIIVVKQFYPNKKRRTQGYVCQCTCRRTRRRHCVKEHVVGITPSPPTPTMLSSPRCSLHSHFPHAHGNKFFLGQMRHVDAQYCRDLFYHPCTNRGIRPLQREWMPAAFLKSRANRLVIRTGCKPPSRPRTALCIDPAKPKSLRRPQSSKN